MSSFEDAFAYSAGDLNGQGPWVAAGGDDSLVVTSPGEVDPPGSGFGASQAPVVMDFSGSFVMEIEFSYVVGVDSSVAGIELHLVGTPTELVFAVNVNPVDDSYIMGILGFVGGGSATGTTSGPGIHTARIEGDGSIVRFFMDGVEVDSAFANATNAVGLVLVTQFVNDGDEFLTCRRVLVELVP